jgi:hypothetical protein
MWGGGGQAGYNTSGQTGGSGSGSYYIRTDFIGLEYEQPIFITVGEGGGQSGISSGGRSLYETSGTQYKSSGGWGGWPGHKNTSSTYGAGGGGGGASFLQKGGVGAGLNMIAAAGGGGGGGGASSVHPGGHGLSQLGNYQHGQGGPGNEMIGNGAGGGGGGGGPNAGTGGANGPDGTRGGGGGQSGGATLSSTGPSAFQAPVGRTPYRFDDGTFKYGMGGLSNGEPGGNGYAEIEFISGGIGYVKEANEWVEIATAYQKIGGVWKEIRSAYVKDETAEVNNFTGQWKIVNRVDQWVMDTTPEMGLFSRDSRTNQYTEPPPPPPPPVRNYPSHDNHDSWYDTDFGGGDGGGGGDSIICTALHKLGYLPHHIYQADQKFGESMKTHDPAVYKGYLKWAEHVVGWLENRDDSNIMPWIKDDKTRIKKTKQWALNWTLPIAIPWTTEMAYQMGYVDKGSYVGKLLMLIGKPICRHLANNNRKVEKKHLIILLAVLGIARFISIFSLTNYNVQSHRRSIDDIR